MGRNRLLFITLLQYTVISIIRDVHEYSCSRPLNIKKNNYIKQLNYVYIARIQIFSTVRPLVVCQIATRRKRISRTYSCETFMKPYAKDSNLTRHLRTRRGKTLYSCEVFKKCFSTSNSFTNLMRTHTGENPYLFEIWMRSYSQ